MNTVIHKDQRGDLIYSLCKIDWLISRAKQPKSLYSRAQMETFSLLRETFEKNLKEYDARLGDNALNSVMHQSA